MDWNHIVGSKYIRPDYSHSVFMNNECAVVKAAILFDTCNCQQNTKTASPVVVAVP